jgi:hypothetical protein
MLKVILNTDQFKDHRDDAEWSPGHNSHNYTEPKADEYPIVVTTESWDDPNGPYCHTHYWKSVKEINEEAKGPDTETADDVDEEIL